MNYLFVDQLTGFRLPSLIHMYKDFDFVVYHDTECGSYSYDEFSYDNELFSSYRYSPKRLPHSILLIKKEKERMIETLKEELLIQNNIYYSKFPFLKNISYGFKRI